MVNQSMRVTVSVKRLLTWLSISNWAEGEGEGEADGDGGGCWVTDGMRCSPLIMIGPCLKNIVGLLQIGDPLCLRRVEVALCLGAELVRRRYCCFKLGLLRLKEGLGIRQVSE